MSPEEMFNRYVEGIGSRADVTSNSEASSSSFLAASLRPRSISSAAKSPSNNRYDSRSFS